MIKSFLKPFISLQNDPLQKIEEEQKYLFEKLVRIVWVILGIYIALYIYLNIKIALFALMFGFFVLTPVTLYLYKRGLVIQAKLLFILSCNLYIFATGNSFALTIREDYYYLAAAVLSTLLFNSEKRAYIFYSFSISVVCWALTQLGIRNALPAEYIVDEGPYALLMTLNFIGAFTINIMFLKVFFESMNQLRKLHEVRTQKEKQTLEILNEILNDQKKTFELLLDYMPNMIFVKNYNNDLKYTFFNRMASQVLERDTKSYIGKSDYEMYPENLAKIQIDEDKRAFESKKPLLIDKVQIQTPAGSKWIQTLKVPIYDAAGNPQLLLGISTDITKQLEDEERFEIERNKAIHNSKLASLGELSAGMAHEINNPLAIIATMANTLSKSKDDPDKLQKKITAISNSVQRIQKIVSGLRKFSRTTVNVPYTVSSIKSIVDDALAILEPKIKKSNVAVSVNCDLATSIECDAIEIEQVIINLVNNSIDAIENFNDRWIKIETHKENENIIIRVIDSGAGISPDVEKNLFQPFYTTKEIGKGTGLGLSIVKGILDEHNAQISLNRNYKNTCFEVVFKEANHAKAVS